MRLPTLLLLTSLLAAVAPAQQDLTTPPPDARPILTLIGKGVQIYVCTKGPAAINPSWTFVAPQAQLFDKAGARTGTHTAGPTWSLKDGGQVKGMLLATNPSPDPSSIPWLLLHSADAKGSLAGVAYIRRSETKGGKAPNTGCDAAHIGASSPIDYTATYTFYTAPR